MNRSLKTLVIMLLVIVLLIAALFALNIMKKDKADTPDSGDDLPVEKTDTEKDDSEEEKKDDEPIPVPDDEPDVSKTDIPADGVITSGKDGVGTYTVTVDPDEYVYVKEDGFERLYPTDDPDGNVFFEVKFIENKTAEEIAPSFPDSYIDFTDYEDCGLTVIANTDIEAELITAQNSDASFEAYLIDMPEKGGVIAISLSYTAETKEAQTARFNEILKTLTVS